MLKSLQGVLVGFAAIAGCERAEAPPGAGASAAVAVGASAPVGRASAEPEAVCPAGKWYYDYADHFLETLAGNSPGARVVSERGSFICTISGTDHGSYLCRTSAGGVENVIEAPSGPAPLLVTVKMNGSSSVDFVSEGPGRWLTTRADNTALHTEIKATLGGRDFPVPAFNSFPGMARAGTVLEYRCEGDKLLIKPIVEGAVTDYARMKRVR